MGHAIMFAAALLVVSGRPTQITTFASTAVARAGERITLTVEVDLRTGVHVYAPGAEGYIPISWTLEDSPAYTAHYVDMPAARKLYLQAIDETVPAYEGRFRLVRAVTIAPGATGRLSIKGTLRYQACDDQMCYKPEKIPLQWTLTVERK